MDRERQNPVFRQFAEHRKAKSVSDGQKIIICCSACSKELCEVWVIRPDSPMSSQIIAECPCGDKSYRHDVDGQFCIGSLEDGNIVIVDMPVDTSVDDNGILLQKIIVETEEV